MSALPPGGIGGLPTAPPFDCDAPPVVPNQFTVTFDTENCWLVITRIAGTLDMTTVDRYGAQTTGGTFNRNGPFGFVRTTDQLIDTIPFVELPSNVNLTQLDLRIGIDTVGTWTGNVFIPECPACDLNVVYDPNLDRIVVSSSNPIFDGTQLLSSEIVVDGNTIQQAQVNQSVGQFVYQDNYTLYMPDASSFGMEWTEIRFFTLPNNEGEIGACWAGSIPIMTYPIILSICSPAPDTIRLVGERFLTCTAGPIGYITTRLADYSSGPPANVLEGGGMNFNLSSPTNGWVLTNHTDTVMEYTNPAFSVLEPDSGPGDFVVVGAAFTDVTGTNMYYYEPWGLSFNTPVDGSGCTQINEVNGIGSGQLQVLGSGLLDVQAMLVTNDGVFPVITFNPFFDLGTDTEITNTTPPLAGTTVSHIELYSDFAQTELIAVWDGAVVIPA